MKKHPIASSIPAVAAGLVFLFVPQARAAGDAEIRIICSNGIKAAMDKLVPQYEHTSGRHIAIQYGASALLKKTIESGEPFDLTILTPGTIDDLIKEGTLKIAAVAPMPSVRVSSAMAVKPGLLASSRKPYRRSWNSVRIRT